MSAVSSATSAGIVIAVLEVGSISGCSEEGSSAVVWIPRSLFGATGRVAVVVSWVSSATSVDCVSFIGTLSSSVGASSSSIEISSSGDTKLSATSLATVSWDGTSVASSSPYSSVATGTESSSSSGVSL